MSEHVIPDDVPPRPDVVGEGTSLDEQSGAVKTPLSDQSGDVRGTESPSGPSPSTGQTSSVRGLGHGTLLEQRLHARALRQRWALSQETRRLVTETAENIIRSPSSHRDRNGAMRVLLMADALDIRREKNDQDATRDRNAESLAAVRLALDSPESIAALASLSESLCDPAPDATSDNHTYVHVDKEPPGQTPPSAQTDRGV